MARGQVVGGSSPRSKLIVAGLSAALIGVIGYSQVWVPMYSPEAVAGRERTLAMRRGELAPAGRELPPGSVWKNMAKVRDAKAEAHSPAGSSASSSSHELK